MDCYYNLKYLTYLDKTATIRVPKAKLVDISVVKAAMETILSSDIIAVSAGLLKSAEDAEFVTIEYEPFTI